MSNIDHTMRGLERASAIVKARRAKQLVEQPDVQSVKEKLQQQLQAVADLKSQIAVFQNTDNVSAATTIITTNNTDKLSDNEQQYQTMIIQKMKAHIKSKRIK